MSGSVDFWREMIRLGKMSIDEIRQHEGKK